MNKALACIAQHQRFVVKELTSGLDPEQEYSVTLNDMNSVPLSSSPRIYLVAGQTIRLYEWHPNIAAEHFRVQALSYIYAFTTKINEKEVDLLTFEWRRDPGEDYRHPHGHMHVGPAVLNPRSTVRPGSFHKAHIPTDRLSFESVVRFAIDELNVKARNKEWQTVLAASEAKFEEHKTS